MHYSPTLRFAHYAKYLNVEKWLKYRLHCLNSALGLALCDEQLVDHKRLNRPFHSICGE